MDKSEFKKFCEAWSIAQEISANGKVYSKPAMVEIFEQLGDYHYEVVKDSIRAHSKQSKYAPTIADLLAIIRGGHSKHIGADEAWPIALASMDESKTVVWTDEIAQARAAAWEVWNAGDPVGARMAFRSAYERIIAEAGAPKWQVTLGFDAKQRFEAIQKSVDLGRLSVEQAQKYLPHEAKITVQKLIETAKSKSSVSQNDGLIVKKLDELRLVISPDDDPAKSREAKRLEFEKRRQAQIDAVDKLIAEKKGELH